MFRLTKICFGLALIGCLFYNASCTSDYYEEWRIQRRLSGTNVNKPDVDLPPFPRWAEVYAIGDYRDIDVFADNALLLGGASGVALVLPEETQHVHDLSMRFHGKGGLDIFKRQSRYDFHKDKGLKISIGEASTKFYQDGILIGETSEYYAEPDREIRAWFIEDGEYSTIIFDCDTVLKWKSELMASENTIIFPAVAGDTIDIFGIELVSLRQWNRDEYITRPSLIRPF